MNFAFGCIAAHNFSQITCLNKKVVYLCFTGQPCLKNGVGANNSFNVEQLLH